MKIEELESGWELFLKSYFLSLKFRVVIPDIAESVLHQPQVSIRQIHCIVVREECPAARPHGAAQPDVFINTALYDAVAVG